MEKEKGLQSKKWNGYFDESKDSIMGSWRRCMICKKIPAEIYHHSRNIFTIWHCRRCNESDYKPKNWLQKLLIKIDAK
jgi:hypothetical protein